MQPPDPPTPPAAHAGPRKRDAAATRARILDAARAAFAHAGFAGARVDAIARAAGTNVQMIYRYFGDKEGLYRAVLEATYAHLRALEQGLDLSALPPAEGIRRLVEFTFDYVQDTPDFVAIIRNENMADAAFARQMPQLNAAVRPLLDTIDALLAQGVADRVFTIRPDAADLYITILSLAITPVAQRATLSALFGFDLADPDWVAGRRGEMVDVVRLYLTAPRPATPAPTRKRRAKPAAKPPIA
ncbi:TetR/AcrR family transcriptional regulator [Xanthobacter agilis]|uniref:AcrR family transcriptional regulator n=1 Tax=Xanthobacter agilis TaxID=47492 RepID=A0ABU0L8B4_XANAG|nr:TetR/AcrR family transcriptional regulator [Xanthobacter agilis]MDQ0503350.1 AcrR family transcriptional regulator [Xanthobacter agilis]